MELECYHCGNEDTITITKSELSKMTENPIIGKEGMISPVCFDIVPKTILLGIYKAATSIGLRSEDNKTMYIYCKKCGTYKQIE